MFAPHSRHFILNSPLPCRRGSRLARAVYLINAPLFLRAAINPTIKPAVAPKKKVQGHVYTDSFVLLKEGELLA